MKTATPLFPPKTQAIKVYSQEVEGAWMIVSVNFQDIYASSCGVPAEEYELVMSFFKHAKPLAILSNLLYDYEVWKTDCIVERIIKP